MFTLRAPEQAMLIRSCTAIADVLIGATSDRSQPVWVEP